MTWQNYQDGKKRYLASDSSWARWRAESKEVVIAVPNVDECKVCHTATSALLYTHTSCQVLRERNWSGYPSTLISNIISYLRCLSIGRKHFLHLDTMTIYAGCPRKIFILTWGNLRGFSIFVQKYQHLPVYCCPGSPGKIFDWSIFKTPT